MLLDKFLPNPFLREVHHIAVRTEPEEAYRTACDLDLASVPWIRALFQLRTIFDPEPIKHLTLRDAYKQGEFILLEEVPDRELVVGAIGKIWRPALQFEAITPEEYATYHKRGFGKVAWSLRCEKRYGGGTLITFELRIGATDTLSTAKMRSYFSVIGPFSRAIRRAVFGKLRRLLGDIYADELKQPMIGDAIILNALGQRTSGITIEAPPEAIWPWLVQMGCTRGGWYSYDWLDNAGIPSAQKIMPQWQQLEPGDCLAATPDAEAKFFVVCMEPYKHLLLGGCVNADTGDTAPPDVEILPDRYFRSTWGFVLEPQIPGITRLIVRARADQKLENKHFVKLQTMLFGRMHNFMEAKQLRTIKRLAEQMHSMTSTAA